MQIFLLFVISQASYFLSSLKQHVLQCVGKWWLKTKTVTVESTKCQQFKITLESVDEIRTSPFGRQRESKTFWFRNLTRNVEIRKHTDPFSFFRLPVVSQHSRKASCVGPSLNQGAYTHNKSTRQYVNTVTSDSFLFIINDSCGKSSLNATKYFNTFWCKLKVFSQHSPVFVWGKHLLPEKKWN